MSRKLRHGRSGGRRQSEQPIDMTNTASSEDEAPLKLPPRRKKFPSSINKVNKWYYNILFVLFLILVVFLFWYGNTYSP